MGAIIGLSKAFPDIRMKCRAEKALIVLGAYPGKYMGMSVFFSLAASLPAFMAFGGSGMEIPAALLAFAGAFALMMALPDIELRARAEEIESSMPLYLRALGMLVSMGLPWRRAIEAACPDEGALREEMLNVARSMDDGSGFHAALSHLAGYDSLALKRAVSQMACAYDTGTGGGGIVKIGDEMLDMERHRMREHGARGSMFGLLFVVFCAIAPTFYMIYSVAGPLAGGPGGTDEGQMALAMLVVFPSISILLLLLSRASMPRSALGSKGGLDIRMLAPGALLVGGFLLFPSYPLPVMLAGAGTGAFIAIGCYHAERRIEQVDERLPDALLSVGGMPGSSCADRVFRLIEEGGFGALSKEAGKTRRQLEHNVRVDAALHDFTARNPTRLVSRAMMMVGRMIETGSLERLSALAEDMIRSAQAERERSQLFSMQKYTLIFGALLIPLVFKMALGLSDAIGGVSGGGAAGAIGAPGAVMAASGVGASAAAAVLVPPYLAIYAVIASAAISDAEGSRSALAYYSAILLALSLGAFHFISF